MRSDDPPVVLLGGDVNAVSAARSAGGRGRRVVALPQRPGPVAVRASRFTTWCPKLPAGTVAGDAWLAWLRQVPASVVIPLSDVGLEFLTTHRKALVDEGHHPAEGDDDFLLAMLDKQATYVLADAAGVDRPRTARVTSVEEAVQAARDIGYPCALKPRTSHLWAAAGGQGKAVVVADEAALLSAGTSVLAVGAEIIVTEIVPGADEAFCSYYGYRDADGNELLHYTKRKLRQYPIHFGGGTYHRTEDVPEAAELGRRFFASAGLVGLGNVEFKRDVRDGRLKLIECNPRITAAAELIRRSGIDLTEVVYAGALGRPVHVGPVVQGLNQWLPGKDLKALRDYRRAGELTTAQWLRSMVGRQTLPLASVEDPLPALQNASTVARRSIARLAPGSRSGA